MKKCRNNVSAAAFRMKCGLFGLLLGGVILRVSAAGTPPAQTGIEKPNVVLFYADDLGWGDLRRNNTNPKHFRYTPNMDRLFSEGIELKNYVTHCVCSPSRAGLLTGRHFAETGSGPLTGGTLPVDLPNIAKDFKAAGYQTGAFGKWHNGMPNFPADGNGRRANFGKEASFNELHGRKTLDLNDNVFGNHKKWAWGPGVNAYGFDRWVGYYNGGGDLFDRFVGWHSEVDWWHDRHYRGDEKGYTLDLITRYATEFIKQNKEQPFFCYIPQEAVHTPIQLKRSDLKEFCEKLESEVGISGQWDYVSNVISPRTKRRLGDVEQIRCHSGEEFDHKAIDPKEEHFAHLVYAAYIYALDKSLGEVLRTLDEIGKREQTLIVFASDNGATNQGVNDPFRGKKHTLFEGGIHVPAAIWWPGVLDRNSGPYKELGNGYEGYIAYYDLYPTLLALTGQPAPAGTLDGINCSEALLTRTECRSGTDDAVFWLWMYEGAIRTKQWKLIYSESRDTRMLFDLHADPSEKNDLARSRPEIAEELVRRFRAWMKEMDYAVSWMSVDAENIRHPHPAPEGDVLEVMAVQTEPIKNPDRDGLFVRFATGSGWDEDPYAYVHPGDRIEYDIYVCEDSDLVKGFYYTPGMGSRPFYKSGNGVNQDGAALCDLQLPKGQWTRQVVGIGNLCPKTLVHNYLALQSKVPGTYHYYLDNVVVRKRDGTLRSVIWASKDDSDSPEFIHKNAEYRSVEEARKAKNFPFSTINISVTDFK